jgi:carbonic anhydrase/acetyltransferase-like protein (isoleucine patch superfamily)
VGAAAVPAHEAVINIHPTAFIAPGAVVLGDVTLGPRASVWYGAVLRGDVDAIVIGEATNIQDGCIVHVDAGRPAQIGARVGVGHRAIVHGCTIEDDCLIGMGSVLLNGVRIGAGSVVAAGAVLPEDTSVPPGSLVVGVPARVTRPVDAVLRERIRSTWQHYVAEAERHRTGAFPVAGASL